MVTSLEKEKYLTGGSKEDWFYMQKSAASSNNCWEHKGTRKPTDVNTDLDLLEKQLQEGVPSVQVPHYTAESLSADLRQPQRRRSFLVNTWLFSKDLSKKR